MKNLFITLCLVLTSLTLTAQEAFNGMWQGDLDYRCGIAIFANEHEVLKVKTACFSSLIMWDEEILSQTKTELITKITYQPTGYTTEIIYTLQENNTILQKYSTKPKKYYTLRKIIH